MTKDPESHAPAILLDQDVLAALRASAPGDAALHAAAEHFSTVMPLHLRRLDTALHLGDLAGLQHVARTLQAAAARVGLARAVHALGDLLVAAHDADAEALAPCSATARAETLRGALVLSMERDRPARG